MTIISDIKARQIIDSRGNPTIEADVICGEKYGRAAVPSGASTGTLEALELRDGDKNHYSGKSVYQAVEHVNGVIRNALIGMSVASQKEIDQVMIDLDGTANKEKLGANTILAVSLAVAHTNAITKGIPLYQSLNDKPANILPVPMINILNGGVHASNSVDMQEFMIIPASASRFSDAVEMGTDVFHCLRQTLQRKGYSTTVGDEGGVAPDLSSNTEAIEMILEAIEASGYKAGSDIFLALDVASSEIYENGVYNLASENRKCNSQEFVDYLADWVDKYPIISIEDGMAEDDWSGWQLLSEKLNDKVQLVGDDLFVTNVNLIQKGIDMNVANSVLIKLNQIGTLTETLNSIDLATNAGYSCVISHRSGETEDTTIADLAVAVGTGQIKTGSLCRTDRVAKYNQLLRIEEDLGSTAVFSPSQAFGRFLSR